MTVVAYPVSVSVEADFDRIALLPERGLNHNRRYHRLLLEAVPPRIGDALDLGCGKGEFARLLAARADRVLALDVSANMIAAARAQSAEFRNIEFRQADALEWEWPVDRFDCIASIAALHHLPLAPMLAKMAASLRPGGVLVIVDLSRAVTLPDQLLRFAAYPLRVILTRGRRLPREVRRAWDEHARTDRYLSTAEVRRACDAALPGAEVRRLVFWRYCVIWQKPS